MELRFSHSAADLWFWLIVVGLVMLVWITSVDHPVLLVVVGILLQSCPSPDFPPEINSLYTETYGIVSASWCSLYMF